MGKHFFSSLIILNLGTDGELVMLLCSSFQELTSLSKLLVKFEASCQIGSQKKNGQHIQLLMYLSLADNVSMYLSLGDNDLLKRCIGVARMN